MGFLNRLLGKSNPLDELEDMDEFTVVAPETADASEDAPKKDYEKKSVPEEDGAAVAEPFPLEVESKTRSAAPAYGVTGRIGPAPRFTWREVACHDGTSLPKAKRHNAVEVAHTLNNMRVDIARHYGVSTNNVFIHINSWFRTPSYNKKIGGVAYSRHCEGDATDINVSIKTSKGMKLVPRPRVRAFAEQRPRFRNGGVGSYSTFTHLDTRGYRARWNGP